MPRVALYARVSGEGQDLASQRAALLAGLGPDDRLVPDGDRQVHEDFAEFSGTIDRPALLRLREVVAAGELDQVRVIQRDRLMRTATVAEQFEYCKLRLELDAAHVAIADASGRPYQASDSDEDFFVDQLMGLVGGLDRRRIARNTQRGRERRYQEGRIVNPGQFYWLQYDVPSKQYVVREREAAVLRQIVEWLLAGDTLRGICRRLMDAGVPAARGREWGVSALSRMLRNPAIAGRAIQHRWVETNGNRRRDQAAKSPSRSERPPQEWISISVPAVIAEPDFEAVQQRLTENSRLAQRNTRREYLLRGLIRCGQCGRAYVGNTSIAGGREYRSYYCLGHKSPSAGASRCVARQVSAPRLEDLVWEAARELLQRPDVVLAELRRQHETSSEYWDKLQAEIDDVDRRQLPRLRRERDTVLDWLRKLPELYTPETASAEMRKVAGEEERIRARRAELAAKLAQRRLTSEQLLEATAYCERVRRNLEAEDRGAVLRLLIADRIVIDGATARWTFLIPTSADVGLQVPQVVELAA